MDAMDVLIGQVMAIYLVVSMDAPVPKQKTSAEILSLVHTWRGTRRVPVHAVVLATNTPPVKPGRCATCATLVHGRAAGGVPLVQHLYARAGWQAYFRSFLWWYGCLSKHTGILVKCLQEDYCHFPH
jgi:hypothetical protein